jgi:hypothetical protein
VLRRTGDAAVTRFSKPAQEIFEGLHRGNFILPAANDDLAVDLDRGISECENCLAYDLDKGTIVRPNPADETQPDIQGQPRPAHTKRDQGAVHEFIKPLVLSSDQARILQGEARRLKNTLRSPQAKL